MSCDITASFTPGIGTLARGWIQQRALRLRTCCLFGPVLRHSTLTPPLNSTTAMFHQSKISGMKNDHCKATIVTGPSLPGTSLLRSKSNIVHDNLHVPACSYSEYVAIPTMSPPACDIAERFMHWTSQIGSHIQNLPLFGEYEYVESNELPSASLPFASLSASQLNGRPLPFARASQRWVPLP